MHDASTIAIFYISPVRAQILGGNRTSLSPNLYCLGPGMEFLHHASLTYLELLYF